AEVVDALAYTVGNDVVFGAGQYALAGPAGKKLLAHELIHVAQQARGSVQATATISQPGDAADQEAARVANQLVQTETASGHKAHGSHGRNPLPAGMGSISSVSVLQRQQDDGGTVAGGGEEGYYEVGDQLNMVMPRWHVVLLPADAPPMLAPGGE